MRTKKQRPVIGRLFLILVLSSILIALTGTGMTLASHYSFPEINSHVTDEARILPVQGRRELESLLRDFAEKTTNQLLVVTISSLPPGESLERYSIKLAEEVGAGTAQEDNGLLLLIVEEERSVRIEVGYGLEDEITDGRAGRVIRQVIIPAFQQGDFEGGISKALLTMINWIAPTYLPTEVSSDLPAPDSIGGGLNLLQMFIIFLVLLVFSAIYAQGDRKRWSRRGFSQSSFGPIIISRMGRSRGSGGFGRFPSGGGLPRGGFPRGGGFSGRGGGFGGGGASGRW